MTKVYGHEVQSDSSHIFLKKTMNSVKISPIGLLVLAFVGALALYYVQQSWWGHEIEVSTSADEISMKQLLSAAIYAAEKGGVEVVKVRKDADLQEQSKGKTKEGANNPVTAGDMKSHEAIVYSLKVTFDGLPVVSEEKEDKPWDKTKVKKLEVNHPDVKSIITDDQMIPIKDVVVWVDPLDATQEYTENLVHYVTTMVCVAIKGEPVIGVIHKPFSDQTTWAWVGHGHSANLKSPPYKVSMKESPNIIVSRSHAGAVKGVAEETFGKEVNVIKAGGAGYKVLELFAGNADAYIHTTLIKKWDICAGNALLKEMSSKMTTLSGESIGYDYKSDPKNDGGLLASIWDHDNFLKKLSRAKGV